MLLFQARPNFNLKPSVSIYSLSSPFLKTINAHPLATPIPFRSEPGSHSHSPMTPFTTTFWLELVIRKAMPSNPSPLVSAKLIFVGFEKIQKNKI